MIIGGEVRNFLNECGSGNVENGGMVLGRLGFTYFIKIQKPSNNFEFEYQHINIKFN